MSVFRLSENPRQNHHHQERIEERPHETQDRPLIPNAQLADDHVLDHRPESNELAAIFIEPGQPEARSARRRRRRKKLRVRDLGTRTDFHPWHNPIPDADLTRQSITTPPLSRGILRTRPNSRKVNPRTVENALHFQTPQIRRMSREAASVQSLSSRGVSVLTPIRAARRTLSAIGHFPDVLRPQGIEPADLASFVTDDDAGQDRAGDTRWRAAGPASTSLLSVIWL